MVLWKLFGFWWKENLNEIKLTKAKNSSNIFLSAANFVVQYVIERGADINAVEKDQKIPLTYMRTETVQVLVRCVCIRLCIRARLCTNNEITVINIIYLFHII